MLFDYCNMDVMLGDGNSNSIGRELDSLINCPERPYDFQFFPNRENSSQGRLIESINMLSGEMNARMSREMLRWT